jgi:two-component system OmpR family sensor kinase
LSASKSKATNLSRTLRKTLLSFLLLYSFLSVVILAFSGVVYYNLQKELMLEGQTNKLQDYSIRLISALRYLHEHFDEEQTYPRFGQFRSAIYDSSKKLIFSTLREKHVNLDKTLYTLHDNIHYVTLLESYYLGAMYVVIEIPDDGHWFGFIRKEMIFYGVLFFLILLLAGYYLMRMMLAPVSNTLNLLDRFIKDTTHELNTPVSAILTNIEMIDQEKLDPALAKKIRRIDIASRTISNLYKDLTFAALGHNRAVKDEKVDLYKLVKERIEFFKVISSAKNIACVTDLKKGVTLTIDRARMTRIIDNILSNAIKYNRKNGYIKITLDENFLEVEDGGIGMDPSQVHMIFERYTRLNKSEGGFGLGLSIVKSIADAYGLKVSVKSEKGKGSRVRIIWGKS